MHELLEKCREAAFSVVLFTVFFLILDVTLLNLASPFVYQFLIGSFLVLVGLTIFLLGVDISISPSGEMMGKSITKPNKKWIVGVAGLGLGFIVSIAEPSLSILGHQVEAVTSGAINNFMLVIVVSVGIALLVAISLLRILFDIKIYHVITGLYLIIFALSFFVSKEFLAITFDASGATTGSLTVPFLLALTMAVAHSKKNREKDEDSFGLIGIASGGAIIPTLILGMFTKDDQIFSNQEAFLEEANFFYEFIHSFKDVTLSIAPIVLLFILFQFFSFKLKKEQLLNFIKGFFFTLFGLTIFLTGVNGGFMEVGREVGFRLAYQNTTTLIIVVGFIIGMLTILAEPAVYILTKQVEEVTDGEIRGSLVLISLALGVGLSVGLFMLKIAYPVIELWHLLLPGYLLAVGLNYFIPQIFVGIAFDSGGVASGPMTATFVLAFCQGVASVNSSAQNPILESFGMIAMVALMPVIALQILGLVYRFKQRKTETS